MRKSIAVILLIFSLSLIVTAQSAGEQLFSRNCIACHGGNGDGKTNFGKKANIPDLRSSEVQNQSDSQLYASIGRGEGHKEYPHGFLSRGMTGTNIKELIAYIRTLKK